MTAEEKTGPQFSLDLLHASGKINTLWTLEWSRKREKMFRRCFERFPGEKQESETKASLYWI